MTCDDARLLLAAYLDEELEDGTRLPLVAHLKECAPCCDHLKNLREAKRLVGAAPVPEPRAGFWEELARKLDEAG